MIIKKAVVHLIHKEDWNTEKFNFIGQLAFAESLKMIWRLLFNQMYTYFDNFFV